MTIKRAINFFKSQSVLCISMAAAVISAVFVVPDAQYIEYINFSTLILLFCLMGAVSGFRECGIFRKLSDSLMHKSSSLRKIVWILMNICFFSSMLITNDVALITFVPVTVVIFDSMKTQNKTALITAVVIETAAANLGSMLLPIGNPQNIFLCSEYELTPFYLIRNILPYGVISYIVLTLSVLLIPKSNIEPVEETEASCYKMSLRTAALSCAIFIVSLLTVAGILNEYICLAVSLLLILAANWKLLLNIDYALLATFVCFFVFSGNIGRIDAVQSFLENAVNGHELETAVIASQVISNVPSAVLLSTFTEQAKLLLIGTNIGGLGTPIASLASLIAYRLYMTGKNSSTGKFMVIFLVYNAVFLGILFASAKILL